MNDFFSQAIAQAQLGQLNQTLPQPAYLNVEYIFYQLIFLPDLFLGWLEEYLGINALALMIIFVMVAVGFGLAIFRILGRFHALRKAEERKWREIEVAALSGVGTTRENARWEKVRLLADAPNEADWRLAILEADAMLDDMLDAAGYRGDGVGEKLKSVEPADFATLSMAWEAHKIRNRIAHEGTQFVLTRRDAKQAIDYFEYVFKEFHFI